MYNGKEMACLLFRFPSILHSLLQFASADIWFSKKKITLKNATCTLSPNNKKNVTRYYRYTLRIVFLGLVFFLVSPPPCFLSFLFVCSFCLILFYVPCLLPATAPALWLVSWEERRSFPVALAVFQALGSALSSVSVTTRRGKHTSFRKRFKQP